MSKVKELFLGEAGKYDYGALCMPTFPCASKKSPVTIYGKGE